MRIGTREIGEGHPVYIIAEIGVNHDGSIDRALELVDAAADAGADAVKTQYFRADALMSRAAKLAAYQKAAGESDPIEMLRRLELSLDDMARIIDRAHARNLHAIVTVFSLEHVHAAAELPWDAFKSASPDVINWPLLRAIAATEKPLIVSTGAATEAEVLRAREWLSGAAREDRVAFLHCVSSYPTSEDNATLGGITRLAELGIGAVGYSDHTARSEMGAWACECSARILEKHLTHDRSAAGPDHAASLDPAQFAEYCAMARGLQPTPARPSADIVGPIAKRVLPCEQDVRSLSRQSIVGVRDIATGASITRDMLTFKRPGKGIEPRHLDRVIGRRAKRNIEADMPITEEDLA